MTTTTHTAIVVLIAAVVFLFSAAESGSESLSPEWMISSQIAELKDQLDRARREIEVLKEDKSIENERWRQKIAVLEDTIAVLREELDIKDKDPAQRIAALKDKVQKLTAEITELLEELLPSRCAKDIEARRFEAAAKKLELLNEKKVAEVIESVYNGPMENIALIREFGKSLDSIQLKLVVYRVLVNKFKSISDQSRHDVYEISQLLNAVKSEIIRETRATAPQIKEGHAVVQKCRDVIKSIATHELQNRMYDYTFSTEARENVTHIIGSLQSVDANFFYETIKDVCHAAYGNVDAARMIHYIESIEPYASRMDGLIALFYAYKQKDGSQVDEMVQIAFDLRNITENNVPSEVQHRFDELRSVLPLSLAAITTGRTLCMKNVHHNGYFFASGWGHDTMRRYPFLFQPDHVISYVLTIWEISQREGPLILIRNVNYNEYLFEESPPNIYTWFTKNEIPAHSSWRMRMHRTEDSVLIQNEYYPSTLLEPVSETLGLPGNTIRFVRGMDRYPNSIGVWNYWKLEVCENSSFEQNQDLEIAGLSTNNLNNVIVELDPLISATVVNGSATITP